MWEEGNGYQTIEIYIYTDVLSSSAFSVYILIIINEAYLLSELINTLHDELGMVMISKKKVFQEVCSYIEYISSVHTFNYHEKIYISKNMAPIN